MFLTSLPLLLIGPFLLLVTWILLSGHSSPNLRLRHNLSEVLSYFPLPDRIPPRFLNISTPLSSCHAQPPFFLLSMLRNSPWIHLIASHVSTTCNHRRPKKPTIRESAWCYLRRRIVPFGSCRNSLPSIVIIPFGKLRSNNMQEITCFTVPIFRSAIPSA